MGSEFIHFSIRAIAHAQLAKRKGLRFRCVLEHPEDLGRMAKGEPAAIWQLPEIRSAFDGTPYLMVAGHQCQFAGVDRKKPTRLLPDILAMGDFGKVGWPTFDTRGYYTGPLAQSCGHRHRHCRPRRAMLLARPEIEQNRRRLFAQPRERLGRLELFASATRIHPLAVRKVHILLFREGGKAGTHSDPRGHHLFLI